MTRQRHKPDDRRAMLLDAAIKAAETQGFNGFSRSDVCRIGDCSTGLIHHYFGTMTQLKRAVMRAAVARGNVRVVAEGLMLRDPNALRAPDDLKARAAQYLTV